MEVIFEFCEDLRGNENNNSIITFTGNGLTYYMLCIEWMMSYVLLSAIRMKLLDSMQKLQVGLLRPFERSYRNMRSVTTSSSSGLALLMCEIEVVTFSPDVHAIWPNTMLSCTEAFICLRAQEKAKTASILFVARRGSRSRRRSDDFTTK